MRLGTTDTQNTPPPPPVSLSCHKKPIGSVLIQAAVSFFACFVASAALAQTVPQPANPPLWDGVRYGAGLYEYNDAILSTGANRLHDIGITGQGVSAAVVNGGFFTNHEIFGGDKIINNYTGPTSNHGTHVSGIVLSMAPGSRLWLENYSGTDADKAEMFSRIGDNASRYNIVSINNSWGDTVEGLYSNPDDMIERYPKTYQAIQSLLAGDIAVVAASGNWAINDRMSFPDGFPGVVSTGALNPYGYIATFSSEYEKPGLALIAPGEKVYSAFGPGPDTYKLDSGTSMASPHVAGAIALLQSGARNAKSAEIINSLYESADRIPYDGSAIVKMEYMDGWEPDVAKLFVNKLGAGGDKYTDWLDDVQAKYDSDTVTADEWRIINHIANAAYTCSDLGWDMDTFLFIMENTGDLNPLQFTDYGFLRADKAYMHLTDYRTQLIAGKVATVDAGLKGVTSAFGKELGLDIHKEAADLFQRFDAQNLETQVAVARQMSPRFTNSVVESAHLGLVGLHRSIGNRTEINRLGQGRNAASCNPCDEVAACDPCEKVAPCDNACNTSCGSKGNVEKSGWIEGFGTGINRTGTLTNAAYNGHFAGTSFGLERKRGQFVGGLFGNWSNHGISGDGNAKGDWLNVGAYGRVDRKSRFVEGSVAYGHGDYKMTRNVLMPGATFTDSTPGQFIVLNPMFLQMNSKTQTDSFSTRVAGGRDLWKRNGWTIGPRGEMSLSYISLGGYTENGSEALNLTVDQYNTTYLDGGVGLHAGKSFCRGSEMFVVSTKIMAMYGGMAGDDFSGKFVRGGSAFTTTPNHLSTAWAAPEVTLSWKVSEGLVLSGTYAGRFGDRLSENTGSVGFTAYW
ncbi:MAG: autotransporter domain-containing protein [Thermoguttaceae bacterium]